MGAVMVGAFARCQRQTSRSGDLRKEQQRTCPPRAGAESASCEQCPRGVHGRMPRGRRSLDLGTLESTAGAPG